MKSVYAIMDYPKENEMGGRFVGTSPKRAAQKAFTQLARKTNLTNHNGKFIVFVMKNLETGKEYKYIGSRVKLKVPKVVYRDGKKVLYKYMNVVGKYKEELNKIK